MNRSNLIVIIMGVLLIGMAVLMSGPVQATYDLRSPGLVLWTNSSHTVFAFNTTENRSTSFGLSNDIPFVYDMYGNNTLVFGVYRPSNGFTYIDRNNDGVWSGATVDLQLFEPSGANIVIPVNYRTDVMTESQYLTIIGLMSSIIVLMAILLAIRLWHFTGGDG